MRCTVTGESYTVFGYEGKQVRDNIHSNDVVSAMEAFHRAPRAAAVYNLGGGRESNCSMIEAIEACERISGRELDWELSDEARMGDHRWWISDLSDWRRDYPDWQLRVRPRDDAARDPRPQRRVLDGRPSREALGRHPRAQRGRGDRADGRRGRGGARGGRARLRDRRRRRRLGRRHRGRSSPRSPPAEPAHPVLRSHYTNGFGFAVRAGLDVFDGRRRRDRDGRRVRRPARPAALRPAARRRLRLRVRLALHPRRRDPRLPAGQAGWSTGSSTPASGCSSGTATTTPRTRSRRYRREVIENVQPLRLQPLQPHRRAAAEGDHPRPLLRGGADLLDEPRGRHVQARAARDGLALRVHRADGVPRAPPVARRLPAGRLPRRRPPARRAAAPPRAAPVRPRRADAAERSLGDRPAACRRRTRRRPRAAGAGRRSRSSRSSRSAPSCCGRAGRSAPRFPDQPDELAHARRARSGSTPSPRSHAAGAGT